MESSRKRGMDAEQFAESWLKSQGLRPVRRNFSCRFGEIDLIMEDVHTLVFVEVRLRKNSRFGTPAATIGHNKQQRLIKTAFTYLQQQNSMPECRFDVIAITAEPEISVEWIPNAFGAAL